MTYVSGGEDFETHETLINLDTFRQYQKAIGDGKEFLILEDRVIKISSIKEILPADDIVNYHLRTGTTLKELGLKEPTMLEQPKGDGTLKKLI